MTLSSFTARIHACGSYLPKRAVTNQELSTQMETSDEWIRSRTGIITRHIAAEGETTSQLAAAAARDAFSRSSISPNQIDTIIVATTTPDTTFPATAAKVQALLGIENAAAFDVQAVCSGFVYALILANSCIQTGQSTRALVIGAETMSRVVDWSDRNTAVLFGDGAGAVILEASTEKNHGILSTHWASDGKYESILNTDGGVSSTQTTGKLRMQGKEVFRHAVEKMSKSVEIVLEKHGISADEIKLFVPHQANARILTQVAERVGINSTRVMMTLNHHANTSAASIPLALAKAEQEHRLTRGDYVLLTALGGGLTWGSVLLKW